MQLKMPKAALSSVASLAVELENEAAAARTSRFMCVSYLSHVADWPPSKVNQTSRAPRRTKPWDCSVEAFKYAPCPDVYMK